MENKGGMKHRSTDPLIKRLRAARLIQDMSLKDAAKRIGCHPHSLGDWERGYNAPQYASLIAWATVLGFEFRETLTKKGDTQQ